MNQRPATLQNFIRAARAAYAEFATDPRSQRSIERIFHAMEERCGEIRTERNKLPVCAHLPAAMRPEPKQKSLRDLADAFAAFEPALSWRRRATYDIATASDNFHDGHGNSMIIGPGGYEDRPDIGLGVSLLAPNVRYPDHDHAPEETYLVMTEGLFRQGDGNWFPPASADRSITYR